MSLKKSLEIEENMNANSQLIEKNIKIKVSRKKSKWSGLFYALLAPLSFAMCNSLIRKCKILNFCEIAFIRLLIQFVAIFPVNIKYKRNFLGEKGQRAKLSIRSVFNVCSILFFYFSIQLINPSDATALFNCCVIFITLFARIFLKELLTIVHIFVLIITIAGIFFISQPEFLFSKLVSNRTSIISSDSRYPFIRNVKNDYIKIFGVGLALIASFAYTIVSLITKKLANLNCPISIICAYFTYFGLPTTFLSSLVLMVTGVEKVSRFTFDARLAYDIFFASISALFGFLGQVLMNMAMQKEDANKVSLLDATGLIYNFLFQYLILGIVSNYLSSLGALLIFIGAILVLSYKILDKRHEKSVKLLKSNNPKGLFEGLKKIFFYKF